MNRVELARRLRPLIVDAVGKLDDKRISEDPEAVHLCDTLHGDGRAIQAGTRINWHGKVKKAAVTLWDRPDSWPDAAPGLWEDLAYRAGIRIIPETITAGLAFAKGERGWWGDQLWESKMENNVWNPAQNPAGWEVVE